MGSEGLERSTITSQKTALSGSGAAISEAVGDKTDTAATVGAGTNDHSSNQQAAELRLIQLAWPNLHQESRRAILGIIAEANKRKRS